LKKLVPIIVILLIIISCKGEDSVSCAICNSSQTIAFEVCEESNGNASVNGENTETLYANYIADLEAAGATCVN
jgi:hypothetical protein